MLIKGMVVIGFKPSPQSSQLAFNLVDISQALKCVCIRSCVCVVMYCILVLCWDLVEMLPLCSNYAFSDITWPTITSYSVTALSFCRVQPQSSFPEVFDISHYPNKLLQSSKQKPSKTKDAPLPLLHEQGCHCVCTKDTYLWPLDLELHNNVYCAIFVISVWGHAHPCIMQ